MPTQKADYAADTSTDDIALRRRRDDAGDLHENWASRTARCASIVTAPADRSRWDHLAAARPNSATEELEQRLFVNGGVRAGARHHVEPDWAAVARELKRPGVNLMILWEEYRAVHSDGYAYSSYVAAALMYLRASE